MEKISVAVRFRPPNLVAANTSPASSGGGGDREWRIDDTRVSLLHRAAGPITGASFAFDHVFDGAANNERIYGTVVRELIGAVVGGFNGTAFAYGQTSSGKTFTMNGSDADPGIIPRAVRDVFDTVRQADDREFLIRVSYMEIYNEEINDLLTLEGQKLKIHESLDRGVYVSGLREEIVNSAEQVFELLQLGEANRHFGETNMNMRSSRSHTIFRMVIESSGKDQTDGGDAIRVSVLNLVDLAGSERIIKTGAEGVRLNEGKYINKSLMILGNVINKLSENGKQRGHIPYRDSKLTRILQPALGGNAKTSIICTAAPEEIHIEETRGTLQFASRAKCVSNCAQVNEILTDAALLKRQKLEIEELRKKLQGSHSEGLEQVVLKLRNDMHKSELERDRLAMELEDERKLRMTLEQHLTEQQKLEAISSDHFTDSIQLDLLKTPDSKSVPDGFVACRSRYSQDVEFSPIPENLDNIAEEDLWTRLNKGCVTDLDMLEMTPNLKRESSFLQEKSSAAPLEEPTNAICQRLAKECIYDQQQLEESKARCANLEKDCDVLRDENLSLQQELSESKLEADSLVAEKQAQLDDLRMRCVALERDLSSSRQEAHRLATEKQELAGQLGTERQKMDELKQDIRVICGDLLQREGQLTSIYTKSKAIIESCKASQVATLL
ncbi:Kinesin-like protein KIN-7N [Zea mays]|uniref:Kinesin-like protein n=1 Tax=Zea mays TaxID=4577 RepID=C0PDH3_MAIZE|nr:Kinesin-like protein KIN-7N [Zea mays]ACN33239.1 unknown [Zea mays]AQK57489.1 Kinesin-like protein KIN-7N [Zea mays]AQK57491.1 Kinesin-like protein KIN-7N [Zea mays]AQK57494.1 Kinesin-like protein KIN-7N [Zea mays]|eukprot:NP_001278584.1 Kinesin-like protein KIN-7N [Zea mays]